MVSIEPPSGASSVGDPPDDDDEKTRRSEILKRELAARQELADTMRLAAELRVKNQEALLKKGRDWADKLFDTANMSGPELDDWTLEGIDIFGPDGERAARDARARQTTRRNGQAVSTETGRIIARDRVSGALFTARLVKPVVKSVDATEFAGLDQEIERDPGAADGSPGETVDTGAVEMGPGDEIARIARQAREGGVVTSATTSVASQLPGRVKQRAKDLKLSREIQARIARTAEDLGEELEITEWLETLGVTIEVPKITRPDISFSDDLGQPSRPPATGGAGDVTSPRPDPATFNDDHLAPAVPKPGQKRRAPTPEDIRASAEAPVLFVFQGNRVPSQEDMAAAMGKTLPEDRLDVLETFDGEVVPPEVHMFEVSDLTEDDAPITDFERFVDCAMEQLGIVDIIALAAVVDANLGPRKLKRMGNATKRTSNLSMLLRKWFPQNLPPGKRIPTITNFYRISPTTTVGVAIVRWIPIFGFALLVYDAVKITECIYRRIDAPPTG